MKRHVDVWQKAHEIEVRQTSRSEWVAVGEYLGQRLEVVGRSENRAVSKWTQAARARGN